MRSTSGADHKTPTGLGGCLNQRGIDKAFVTGLATDFCVAWTAIDARNVGFETYVAFAIALPSAPNADHGHYLRIRCHLAMS